MADPGGDADDALVYVFDRRTGESSEIKVKTGGVFSFDDFKLKIEQIFAISSTDEYVITTTNREHVRDDSGWDAVENGDTLYILKSIDQELSAPTEERVNYLPHYDTIVKGGMYEYYASEGQNPIPFAFAELIDNSLAATCNNESTRHIEIRLHLDESNPAKNIIVVLDNGKGMTPRELNNWAVYRLSKFNRTSRRSHHGDVSADESVDVSMMTKNAADQETKTRFLNSDISFFGVGGKQAIFFMGTKTRILTKSSESRDVHELSISQEEFQKREMNKEAIYHGLILNRKPGDGSHLTPDEEVLRSIIGEEVIKPSFTCVVIEKLNMDHVNYLRHNTKAWTRQLAHIYHYYLHGPEGNTGQSSVERAPSPFRSINIDIKAQLRPNVPATLIHLREIDDDMQTQYLGTCVANVFEFKAIVESYGKVEGVLRYHPFMYDHETYPINNGDLRLDAETDDDHDYAHNDRPARGRRPIFECYWNGRLIPYTHIYEFDWCATPKKSKSIPVECYNRVSGVLWTNDKFAVSTNKLTFTDLEMKLRDKGTIFTRVFGNQERRTAIDKEFTLWLMECHELYDKQIKFSLYQETITRSEMPRNRQSPWGVFHQIEWGSKTYRAGNLVRVLRSTPPIYGRIACFYLFGEYNAATFATGGDFKIIQEPCSLYNESKTFPLSRLDRSVPESAVRLYIEDEESKLPSKLLVVWPEGSEVAHNDRIAAGQTIGAIKVDIANRKGEVISRMPGNVSTAKKLQVELSIIYHHPSGDQQIVSHICSHSKNWGFWFRKRDNIRNIGLYTLTLQCILGDVQATEFFGKQLPLHKIKFNVTEAEPNRFTIGMMDGPFRVGSPFQMPLEFLDEFLHPTKPPPNVKPLLEATGLQLTHDSIVVRGHTLLIKGVIALATLTTEKNYNLTVKVPGLTEDTQSLKIRLLPGLPKKLVVFPENDIEVENGQPVSFNVTIHDVMDNTTTDTKLSIACQFEGVPAQTLPGYNVDCSNVSSCVLTGPPLSINKIRSSQRVTARIRIQGYSASKDVDEVVRYINVSPSHQVSGLELKYKRADGSFVKIRRESTIVETAGDSLNGLEFSLCDEAKRTIVITEKIVRHMKVSWTPRLQKDNLLAGQLPPIRVPLSVNDDKYCNIMFLDGSKMEFGFVLKAEPGEPAQLQCKPEAEDVLKCRRGEKMSNLHVMIRDNYGNSISPSELGTNWMSDLTVHGDDLDTKDMVISPSTDPTITAVLSGLVYSGKDIGNMELCVSWGKLKHYIKYDVSAGQPSSLLVPGWDLGQPTVVYMDDPLPQALVIRLADDAGHACSDTSVKIQIARESAMKLIPPTQPLFVDKTGHCYFGTPAVTGKCGQYSLQPRAVLSNKTTLMGPKIPLNLCYDPFKPTELHVTPVLERTYTVGHFLPDLLVAVKSSDDDILKNVPLSEVVMVDSHSKDPASIPTEIAPTLKYKSGLFVFRGVKVPIKAGEYNIFFKYSSSRVNLSSLKISYTAVSEEPSQLVWAENPGTPAVSNSKSVSSRTIIRSLHLHLKDKYDNLVESVNGKISVEIACDTPDMELPVFVGGNQKIDVTMIKGVVHLQNIVINEDSPGKDRCEYVLKCSLTYLMDTVPPLYVPFVFCNDVKKQKIMTELTKERDILKKTIDTFMRLFNTTKQIMDDMLRIKTEAMAKEMAMKADLIDMKMSSKSLAPDIVAKTIEELVAEKESISKTPRRICAIPTSCSNDQEVLGKIGHLALVSDERIASVLSWHMSADMDCIITITSKKAKDIFQQTSGRQQVLPLDSIYKKNLPDWHKPLPHVKFKPNWSPPGNPVYARDVLIFPTETMYCRIVFGMLLGDTLILDNLNAATAYRKGIIQYTHCPTMLTREGDRIRSNGKFGGVSNKAVPLERLKGAVFGEPLPESFSDITFKLEKLHAYHLAIAARVKAEDNLAEQETKAKSPEQAVKVQELNDTKQRLADIEQKIFGLDSKSSAVKREAPSTPTSTDSPPNKRQRIAKSLSALVTSPADQQLTATTPTPANGSTPVTPTRQSARIAADPRLRAKKVAA